MVYIMNDDRPVAELSEEYYRMIETGYRENWLDTTYLETTLNESVRADDLRQDEKIQMKMQM